MQEAGPGTARGGRDEVKLSSVAHPGTIPHLAHATPPLFLGAFLGKDNVSILSRATRKKNVRRTPAFLLLHRRPSLLVFARLPAPRTGKGSSRIAR